MPVLDSTAFGKLTLLDTGVTTATLPPLSGVTAGQTVTLVNRTSNVVTVSPMGANTIDRYGTAVLNVSLAAGNTLEIAAATTSGWVVVF